MSITRLNSENPYYMRVNSHARRSYAAQFLADAMDCLESGVCDPCEIYYLSTLENSTLGTEVKNEKAVQRSALFSEEWLQDNLLSEE